MLAIATGCKDSSANEKSHLAQAQAETTTSGAEASGGSVAGSSHIDGKNYKIDAAQSGDCSVGLECHVTVRLAAQGDYHINGEYPYKLKADGANIEFLGTDAAGKNTFSKSAGDFVADPTTGGAPAKGGTMTIKFKASAKGAATINGTFKMSVCSAQNCQLETQEISAAVTVK
ncbi:MAG TPA: hypothetical protein VF407_05065 [Polyangiaceae bacterium]